MRPWIMVAGPYTSGAGSAMARARNLTAMNTVALSLFRRGYLPVIGVNMALPMINSAGDAAFDEIMMPVSLELSERCDAILRIEGNSKGADAEVERFAARGCPIYHDLSDVPEVEQL